MAGPLMIEVVAVIREFGCLPDTSNWTAETSLEADLGLDSMDIADLCIWLEDEFGFEFDFEDVKRAATLGGLSSLVRDKQSAQNIPTSAG